MKQLVLYLNNILWSKQEQTLYELFKWPISFLRTGMIFYSCLYFHSLTWCSIHDVLYPILLAEWMNEWMNESINKGSMFWRIWNKNDLCSHLCGVYQFIKVLLIVILFESYNSSVREAGQKLFSHFPYDEIRPQSEDMTLINSGHTYLVLIMY